MIHIHTFESFLNEKLNEGRYQQDLRNIHFETDPKRQ